MTAYDRLPPVCFWPVWAVHLYGFARLMNRPRTLLVQDNGAAMIVWDAV